VTNRRTITTLCADALQKFLLSGHTAHRRATQDDPRLRTKVSRSKPTLCSPHSRHGMDRQHCSLFCRGLFNAALRHRSNNDKS